MCQHAWLLPCLYKELTWAVGRSKGELQTSPWSSKEKRKGGKEKEEGRRRRRKGEEKGRKGKEERRKERRKEKMKGEEERKKKEEEEGVLRNEQTRTAKNPELRYKR